MIGATRFASRVVGVVGVGATEQPELRAQERAKAAQQPAPPQHRAEPAHTWLAKATKSLQPLPAMVAGALHCVREVVRDRPLPQTQSEKVADAKALDVMRAAVLETDAESKPHAIAWARGLAQRSKLTVLEHTAVTYLLRSELFDATASADEAAIVGDLRAALRVGWKGLTGGVPTDEALLERLPVMTLRKASREARVYHAAAFQPPGALHKPDELATRLSAASLLRDYVPENTELVLGAAGITAGALTAAGAPLIATTLLTYCFLSLSESVLHSFAGHQRAGSLAQWISTAPAADAPWLQRKWHGLLHRTLSGTLERTRISHGVVHHFLTFKSSFTQMFDNPEHQARVDAFIAKQRPDVAADIHEELYGSTLSLDGCLRVLRAIAPPTAAAVTAALCMGAPAWCAIPSLLMALGFPLSMKTVHPYQHVAKDEALANAGPLLRSLLQTRWAAWSTRNHELHHQGECNYNLAFAGADWLRGTLVQPNLEDLFRMREEGVLHY